MRRLLAMSAVFASLAGASQAMATFAVGDRVWNDTNNNGVFDATEVGIPGVSVSLYPDVNANCIPDGTTAVRTGTTNASGAYLFTGVGSTNYVLQLEPSNFTGLGPLVGFTSSTGASSTTTGPFEPGLLESNSATDNNRDHGTNATTSTGAKVIRACQIVIVGGTEPVGEGNNPPGIINPDTDPNTNNTIDLGVYKPTVLGALGDRVWQDVNHNGIQDAGEPGVAGVTVRLLDSTATTVLATATTNATGNYLFANLAPGPYVIDFVAPAGGQFTLEDIGTDAALDSDPNVGTGRTSEGIVTAGQTNTQIDAGIWYPLTLGNLVWRDANNNGLVDAGEAGIAGVTVELLNSAGAVVATTTTNATGNYTFTNLVAGDYVVRIPATNFAAGAPLAGLSTSTGNDPAPDPDNNVDSDDNGSSAVGGVVTSAPVTLSANTEPTTDGDGANGNLTVDFGFIPPLPGALGDRVWLDANRNGIQDAGETGVAGATVRLLDATGVTLLATTTTDANGNYLFSNLQPGTYAIDFVLPAGAQFTLEDIGADQAVDSDPSVTTGRTTEGVVVAGVTNTQIDAGIWYPLSLGNLVWRDTNNSGTVDGTETGIAGVTVELLDSAGLVAATTTTNASGNYLFTGLVPGVYSVRLPASNFLAGAPLAGLETSTGNDPAPDPDNNVDNDDNGTASAGTIVSAQITLASGTEPTTDGDGTNGNLTVDFGLIARAAVGDFVWLDQNGNGVQDAGEPGVAGVTVSLCNSAGTVIATATTDANGAYLFQNLNAGSYLVGFTTPAGASFSPANQGTNDAVDSDATVSGACNIPVTLGVGETNRTVDAGVYVPLSLGNLVWRDVNNSGTVDGAEAGISGVTVQLVNAAGTVVATTTTNATGNYLFTGLAPGDYTVRIPATNFAAGAPLAGLGTSTGGLTEPAPDPDNNTDNDDNGTAAAGVVSSLAVTLASGTEPTTDGDGSNGNLTVDFGFTPLPASVGNFVWLDQNGNGIQDPGEPGLAGVTVTLCNSAGATLATTTTDASGNYLFQNLAPGSYFVGFTTPTGAVLSPANQGTNDAVDSDATVSGTCNIPVTLAAGETNLTVDAGMYVPLNLGDLVWRDNNNNGLVDAGEPGIAGVTVQLVNSAGTVVATNTTSATGNYLFVGLAPGDYTVRIPTTPAGLTTSTGNDPAPDPDNNVNNDDNGSLVGGAVQSAPVTLASGTEPTTDGDGANGNLTVDFGFTPLGAIGDLVWLDQNGNGVQDAGEPGQPGVTVTLCNSAGSTIATATTDANGAYLFPNLPAGSYLVGFTAPTGAVLSPANQGTNDAVDSDATVSGTCNIPVTLALGEVNRTVDAGVYFPLSLGDLVWRDANNNGLVDAGEPGISGVTVQLVNAAATVIATTTTDATGNYLFTGLAPGDYTVRVPTTPAGTSTSTGNDPAPDPDNNVNNDDNGTLVAGVVQSAPVTLASGAEPTTDGDGSSGNLTVDFGFAPLPASIGNLVWLDQNGNGIQDPGEPGLAGVTVTLCNAAGTPVGSAVTDAAGNYLFQNLAPGSYLVGFTTPTGAVLSPPNQGANDAVDSDATTSGVCNIPVTLAAGESDLTVDAGMYVPLNLGDLVWRDNNNNGLVDAGEPGLSGVTVQLLNSAGTVVATNTTSATGNYLFVGLAPGDYTVRIPTTPAGLTTSTGNDPAPDPDNNVNNDDNGSLVGGAVQSAPITLASGTEPTTDGDGANGNLTVDFGFTPQASVGDLVWQDTNHNGIQDPGEPGLPGVTVTLCSATGTTLGTAVTDANGNYVFAQLAPGTYRVGFTGLPAGGQLTTANQGANDAVDSDATAVTPCDIPVTLAPGEANTSVDAGVWFPLTLGNLVFRDLNNNGVVDTGEAGIAGVTVQLVDAAGNVVATTTTGADGTYLFTNLTPGDYVVRIPAANFTGAGPLVNFTTSTGNDPAPDPDNNVDNDDNGAAAAGGVVQSAPVTLAIGTEPTTDGDGANGNRTVDFGFVPPPSVGDRVWQDTNHNGIQDPGEPGIGGVTVTLCNSAGATLATTTTDANGNYLFANLAPGSYLIGFSNTPAGSQPTVANQGTDPAVDSNLVTTGTCNIPVTLTPGKTDLTVDAGLWFPLTLGNQVFRDTNNNGIRDAGEPGIAGVTLQLLDAAGNVVATTTSAADGTYQFTGLVPGDYSVRIPATNFAAGAALDGLATSTGGSSEPATDPDNNTDNDDNGTASGTTVVSAPITLAPFTEPSTDGDGTNGNLTLDFGFYLPDLAAAAIGDRVWLDQNGNGIQDPGEPGQGGVTVTLCVAGQVVATQVTGPDGAYRFTGLAPGTYQVGFTTLPAGGRLTTANAGTDAAADSNPTSVGTCTVPVTVAAGQTNNTIDAGVVIPLSLGNLVFNDVNNNGVRDPAEAGVGGVTIQLLDAAGAVVATTTTAADGTYQFTGLNPGNYRVTLPASNFAAAGPLAGFVSSTGTNGSATGPAEPGVAPNTNVDNDDNGTADAGTIVSGVISLASGDEPDTAVDGDGVNGNQTLDLGVFAPAAIGDRVWADTNRNGVQDAGEAGVAGVTVTLLQNGQPVATTTTNAAGAYLFTNLAPGAYTVAFSNLPAGASFVPADQGADDAVDSDVNPATGQTAPIVVAAGERNLTVDAGIVPPASLGDRVWLDANANGVQDAGETGVAGVIVSLFDAEGATVGQVTTDPSGNYLFGGLTPGTYSVGFTGLPAGSTLSPANQGGDDAADSDANPADGKTGPIVLGPGERNLTVDAGIVGPPPPPPGVIAGTPQTTLSLTKRPNVAVAKVGRVVTFTIVVRNTGANPAINVKVCDPIPAGMRFVRAAGAKFERGRPCWTVSRLEPGTSRTVRIQLRMTAKGLRRNVVSAVADNAAQVTARAAVRVVAGPGSGRLPAVTG